MNKEIKIFGFMMLVSGIGLFWQGCNETNLLLIGLSIFMTISAIGMLFK